MQRHHRFPFFRPGAHRSERAPVFLFLAWIALLCLGAGTSARAQSYTVTVLHTFQMRDTSNGAIPTAPLIQGADGNFYGTTSSGAATDTGALVNGGPGTVFGLTPGGSFALEHVFEPLADPNPPFINTDGYTPGTPLLQASDGNFYGATGFGGPTGWGTIYRITPAGALTVLHNFSAPDASGANADGLGASGLIQGSDGALYGVTGAGGANNTGTVFKITLDGTLTTLHMFAAQTNNTEGAYPGGGLLQASDGNFYGTTDLGGANNCGTIFQITPAGSFTVLHAFGGPLGVNPEGVGPPLVQGADGALYGATYSNGPNDSGALFKITLDGVFTDLHDFSATNASHQNGDGSNPTGLIQGSDGNFYGVTAYGGANGTGTIFQLTPAGALTTLYTFSAMTPVGSGGLGNTEGAQPVGLVEGSDGTLYVTTSNGGTIGSGASAEGASGTAVRLNLALPLHPFDILFQNGSTGQLAAWTLNGEQITGGAYLSPGQDPAWQAVGEADFNQDGTPDLLFQNLSTGQLALWLMNGDTAVSGQLITPSPPPGWRVTGLADLDGDGSPDILFQNATSGQLAVWQMQGTTPVNGMLLAPAPPAGWQAVCLADFNADGSPDILFQNTMTGQLAVWYMEGVSVVGGAYLSPVQDPAWKAVAALDLKHNGSPDILFQNTSTAELALWRLYGTQALTGQRLDLAPPPGWSVAGAH